MEPICVFVLETGFDYCKRDVRVTITGQASYRPQRQSVVTAYWRLSSRASMQYLEGVGRFAHRAGG